MKKFIKDVLTPTDYYYDSLFPARKLSVNNDLKDAFTNTSDLMFKSVSMMGSAYKKTMITPVEDLDLLALFELTEEGYRKYNMDSFAFINRIRSSYDGYKTQTVGTRGQAIRVFYQNFGHVDIAPVLRYNPSTYKIPNGKGLWISTSPEVANAWFLNQHRVLDYRLKDLVKLVKKWNREHSKRLSSFHLETMCANMFTSLGVHQDLNLRDFFNNATRFLDLQDPGGHGGVLSSYLTPLARIEVVKSFVAAAERATAAVTLELQEKNHDAAIDKWRIILGSDFPKIT